MLLLRTSWVSQQPDNLRYSTQRRLRRDVTELNQYLPPQQEQSLEVSNQYSAPQQEQSFEVSNQYSAPQQEQSYEVSNQYSAPQQEQSFEVSNQYSAPQVENSGFLADDGYHYKTVRRLRVRRRRRDVGELNQYLPPQQEQSFEVSNQYLAPQTEESGFLADDGYRYKAVRRLRRRKRSEIGESSQYLPPVQQEQSFEVSNQYLPPQIETSGFLANDGYRYKTVRRLRSRKRRDVSELNQYLPPTYESGGSAGNEYVAPIEQESGFLADDGYRYKTVKRSKVRRRL
uniref:Uncharacterized protein n=1 Tax=Glossina brevipalpis TaxID=37001 RepID=A0A1A9WAM8_9MUSC